MALPEDHLAKFHKIIDAKDMWDAIKSRFGGNDESKKMQIYISKQQFKGFSVSNSEGLHKGYDRVFESDIKGSNRSSSSAKNVAFVSSESTNSTNDVSTAYGVSTSSGYNSQRENSSTHHHNTDELIRDGLKMASSHDFNEIEEVLQEDRSKGNQDSRRRDAWNTGYREKDNGRRPGKQEEPKALVTLDGEGVDWTGHAEDEQENFALMASHNPLLLETFNFSKFIFDAMVKNLDNPHKFLMYLRFIQICLNKQMRLLQPHTRSYPTPVLTHKVFSNMKRVIRGYSGDDIPLFPSMITTPETSPSRITSSPSLSPQHTPVSAPLTSPPIPNTTPIVEEPAPMPHESPLQSVHSLGCDEGSVSLNELMALVT
ncbi:hypothetical protein Tco_1095767 [Tanacetum coccineum]